MTRWVWMSRLAWNSRYKYWMGHSISFWKWIKAAKFKDRTKEAFSACYLMSFWGCWFDSVSTTRAVYSSQALKTCLLQLTWARVVTQKSEGGSLIPGRFCPYWTPSMRAPPSLALTRGRQKVLLSCSPRLHHARQKYQAVLLFMRVPSPR